MNFKRDVKARSATGSATLFNSYTGLSTPEIGTGIGRCPLGGKQRGENGKEEK
jgi:hypothetical protein